MEESKQLKSITILIGSCLSMILLLLPFALSSITTRHSVVFLMIAIALSIILLKKKDIFLLSESGKLLVGIIVFFIFNLSNEANILQKLNIELKYNVPLATVFLSLGFLFFLIKIGIRGSFQLPKNPYFTAIVHASVFLFVAMLLFFPALKIIYNYRIDSNLLFLRNIFQILFAILLVYDFLSSIANAKIFFIVLCGLLYVIAIMSLIK